MLPADGWRGGFAPPPASGEIVAPRPDRLGVTDPDAEGRQLVIGLIQAEGLVGILLAPLHKLVAVEAVVIPVKDPVGLDQSDGFVDLHDWPPGTVLLPLSLASGDGGRGLNVHAIGLMAIGEKGGIWAAT